jgi:hypothetical protein
VNLTRPAARRAASAALALGLLAAAPAAADVPLPPAPAGTRRIEVPLPPPPTGSTLAERPGWLAVAGGPWSAFDLGRGAAVTVDYGVRAARPVLRAGELEWHLVVLAARPAETTDLYRTPAPAFPGFPVTPVLAGTVQREAILVEVVPTARVRLPLAPGLALFADGGLGLSEAIEETVEDETFVGKTTSTRAVTAVVLRLGAGISYDATDRLRVVFHPIAFSAELGSRWSAFSPTLGLAFRL